MPSWMGGEFGADEQHPKLVPLGQFGESFDESFRGGVRECNRLGR